MFVFPDALFVALPPNPLSGRPGMLCLLTACFRAGGSASISQVFDRAWATFEATHMALSVAQIAAIPARKRQFVVGNHVCLGLGALLQPRRGRRNLVIAPELRRPLTCLAGDDESGLALGPAELAGRRDLPRC